MGVRWLGSLALHSTAQSEYDGGSRLPTLEEPQVLHRVVLAVERPEP